MGLPNSPSLGMSMPRSFCARTTSPMAERSRVCSAVSSSALTVFFAHMARKSAGRGRLPTWVVRMRSVLRFMAATSRLRGTEFHDSYRDIHRGSVQSCGGVTALIPVTYCSNWNRRPGGFPASYFNSFMRGTETSLQIFRIFINSLGAFQSLFDSQVTFTQVVCFSQEHTFWSRPPASSSSVRYQV